jgi:pantoate--beta-alanine ligase
VRLSAELRAKAPAIHQTLVESLTYAKNHSVAETQQFVTDKLNSIDDMEVEYYTIANPLTMQAISNWTDAENPVGCITVYCGEVRLIDNITYK